MREFKILREQLTSRGGGIEIDLTPLGFSGHKMSAYQNYLGGGMLGKIVSNDTIRTQCTNVALQLEFSHRFKELDLIGEKLMKLFYKKMNGNLKGYRDVQNRNYASY